MQAISLLKPVAAAALLCAVFACRDFPSDDPVAASVLPTARQTAWQKMEYYMFVHFGPNTFTDREWGLGSEDPDVFCPTDLDCRQWAATAKAAGMRGIILTAKHHDGFCLWPSRQSTHTVRESKWRGGRGDVLRELSDACREYGIGFGVYVSPWDRNHPAYGTPAYNEVFAATLREVLTGYGPVFEQWLDGANGEGPDGKRQEYDWELFLRTIDACQPGLVVFSDIGPGCRWIGNERGEAGETCWSRLCVAGFTPGAGAPPADTLNCGYIAGEAWVPGEAVVSIRPGWFYSPATDDRVKSVGELFDIYCASVGRNANLLLNVPADRRGRIPAPDSTRLMELRRMLDNTFRTNRAQDAAVSVRGGRRRGAQAVTDGSFDTFWQAREREATVELTLREESVFDLLLLQEYIPRGQFVAAWRAEYLDAAGQWKRFAAGTTIGYKRIVRFDPVWAQKVRIRIDRALGAPALSEIGLFQTVETTDGAPDADFDAPDAANRQ